MHQCSSAAAVDDDDRIKTYCVLLSWVCWVFSGERARAKTLDDDQGRFRISFALCANNQELYMQESGVITMYITVRTYRYDVVRSSEETNDVHVTRRTCQVQIYACTIASSALNDKNAYNPSICSISIYLYMYM